MTIVAKYHVRSKQTMYRRTLRGDTDGIYHSTAVRTACACEQARDLRFLFLFYPSTWAR